MMMKCHTNVYPYVLTSMSHRMSAVRAICDLESGFFFDDSGGYRVRKNVYPGGDDDEAIRAAPSTVHSP